MKGIFLSQILTHVHKLLKRYLENADDFTMVVRLFDFLACLNIQHGKGVTDVTTKYDKHGYPREIRITIRRV